MNRSVEDNNIIHDIIVFSIYYHLILSRVFLSHS